MKKNIFTLVLNIMLAIIVITGVVMTVFALSTREDEVVQVMDYVVLSIQTDSMEDTIMVGDLILTERYDNQRLEEGEIISFFTIIQDQRVIMTHRIVEVQEAEGMITYVTQGDNNLIPDQIEVPPGDIISVYSDFKVPFLGGVFDLLGSQYGFFFLIIIPLFAVFVYQVYNFIILIVEKKKEAAS